MKERGEYGQEGVDFQVKGKAGGRASVFRVYVYLYMCWETVCLYIQREIGSLSRKTRRRCNGVI